MRKSFIVTSLSLLALLSVSLPAFAQGYHSDSRTVVKTRNGHTIVHQKNYNYKNGHRKYKHKRYNRDRNRSTVVYNTNSNWNWDRHNWQEQRQYMRDNWRARRARMNAAQQAQIDAQLRAQYLAYRGNSYNGAYTWDMYSEPEFLDYVHTRNPSLLGSLRNILGF
jgi:hypothetical protein